MCFALGVLPVQHEPQLAVSMLPTISPPYTSVAGMFECLSIFVFAFSCAQNIPPLAYELVDATPPRLFKMVAAGVAMSAVMYQATAWCGSVAFGASVDPNLLRSFPITGGVTASAIGVISRIAVILNVGAGFPLYMHPARSSLSGLFFGTSAAELRELSYMRWAVLTAGLFGSSWV